MKSLLVRLGSGAAVLWLGGCAHLVTWNPQNQPIDSPEPVAPAPPRAGELVPMRPVGPTDYMVRKGDTLYSIAFRNQVDFRDVARWNHIGADYLIYPGQVLRLAPPPPLVPTGPDIAHQPVEMDEPPALPQPLSTKPTPVVTGSVAPPMPVPGPVPVPVPVAGAAIPTAAPPAVPTPVAATPVIATPAGSGGMPGWRWPVDGTVVRGFNPAAGGKGLDFTGTVGQPVVAASSGKVVYSGSALKGYGELVIIKHDDLRLSAYGYNSRRLVSEGDSVIAGQQIAELGLGPENKPLMHFEIRERGKPVNPVPFLPAR